MTTHDLDWARCSVVLLKPDCLQRGLVDAVLDRLRREVTLVAVEEVTVADWQIFTHYWDLLIFRHRLDVDVVQCLRRLYIGRQVVIALAVGENDDTAVRLRARLGHFDPSAAAPGTLRADFGHDSLAAARREHRLVNNLIHTSDDPGAAWRDAHLWFGGHRAAHLLHAAPSTAHTPTPPPPA